MSAPRIAALVALCGAAAACGGTAASDDGADIIRSSPVETVPGVGRLPDPLPAASVLPGTSDDADAEEPIEIVVPTTEPGDESTPLVGELATGNRLMVIGDSILASTASRFGGELCDVLEPLGWQVAVEAEPGRFVEFGDRVLDRLLDESLDEVPPEDDWHAAVVHLGSNYDGDQENYRDELGDILFRLAPRPTVLLTVTEYRSDWSEVNEVIREMEDLFENVRIVDWNVISQTPGVLSSDGLHPIGPGQDVLVEVVTAEFGEVAGEGDCLRSQFTDDSAIGGGSSGGSGGGGGTGTFGTGGGSSSSGGSSSGSSTGGSSGSGTTTTVVGGTDTGGDSTGGDSGGDSTGGDTDTGGDSTGDDATGGDATGGADTGGDSTGGDTGGDSGTGTDTGGDSSGGGATGGDGSSGGADTGGDSSGGGSTGSDSTGGDSSGGDGSSSGGGATGGDGSSSGGGGSGGSSTGGDGSSTGGSTGGSSSGGTTGTTGGSSTGGSSSGGAATGGTTAPPSTDG